MYEFWYDYVKPKYGVKSKLILKSQLRFRRFRYKANMTINDNIRDKKLQYNINREGAKLSVLIFAKINKSEYLTGNRVKC